MRFDPFDPALRADPYPVYAHFREGDPVHHGRPPTPGDHSGGWWYLFRYADVVDVLKDPRFGRAIAPALDAPPPPVPPEERDPFWELYRQWTLALEPPDHTRQRAALNRAFTARVVEGLRPRIAATAGALLDGLRPRDGFDVVADYAFPLALTVIADLLGIAHDDLDRVKAWSLTIAAVLDYKPNWDVMAEGNRMARDFATYMAAVVAARRRQPADDLITRLLKAVDNGQLGEDELVALCVMLLFAGHETTVNLISAGALLLLENPGQLALFRARPELNDSAVDEFLRLHSPIQATTRIAYADSAIGGRLIRRGESATLLLGAANRDPAAFADPDRLDIARRPNRHLAFGRGIHYCLGAPLAVAQGGIALRLLFERFPSLRLAAPPAWSATFGFRGLAALPVHTKG